MKTDPLFCSESTPADGDALECRISFDLATGTDGSLMYLPAGEHTVNVTQGSKAVTKKVLVEPGAVAALNTQLAHILALGKSPMMDFNHNDDAASHRPTGFEWRTQPAPGVYALGEWTGRGKEAVKGREYSHFSPRVHVEEGKSPARVIFRASDRKPNLGGLVNDPAFNTILPVRAKHAAGAHPDDQNQNQNDNMTPEQLAALQAKNTELQNELATLKADKAAAITAKQNTDLIDAKLAANEAELKAGKLAEQNAALEAKAAKFEADDKTRRTAHAKQFVASLVARGAIAPKDTAAIAAAEKNVAENPETFEPLYAKWQGSSALAGRMTPNSSVASGVQLVSADPQNVFAAYEALLARNTASADPREKTQISREMGAIYAREFRADSRLLDSPILAANSVGTLAGTLVAQRVLELLKLTFPALTRFTTDFSDQSASYNQTINTRIVSIPTVQTYNTSTGWTASDDTTTDVNVTINAHKGVPITFDSNTLASTVRNLFNEAAPAQSYALAKNMVDALYANITAANFTAAKEISALADFSRANVINIGVAQNIAGVPMGPMNRTLLLYSTYFGKLAQDAAIVTLAAFQKGEIITDGALPNVHGYAVVDAPNLPAGSDAIVGFGGSKSALVIATRMPNDYSQALPGSSYGNVTTVTDPDLGISVMLVEYVDHKLGQATRRISLMYGTAIGQATAGQLLTSA